MMVSTGGLLNAWHVYLLHQNCCELIILGKLGEQDRERTEGLGGRENQEKNRARFL